MEKTEITGVERKFSPDEFIVSKTDNKGIITYANDVFLKIADYKLEEVIGKPHNLIRHPWMPKCVFKLLWSQIQSEKEIFAYVVNRTKFGDHYWVFAHVTPSYNEAHEIVGYHSNRRLPSDETIAKIEPLYKSLLEIEQSAASSKEGLEKSTAALHDWVEQQGGNYDALIHTL